MDYTSAPTYPVTGTHVPSWKDPILPPASDPEAQKFALGFPLNTPANRHDIFTMDPQAVQSCNILGSLVLGGSLETDIPDIKISIESGPQPEEAKRACLEFFEDFNYRNDNVNSYVQSTIADNVIHGFSMWRNLITKDRPYNVDCARLDPRTLTFHEETSRGWTWIIQRASQNVKSKKDFFSTIPWFGAYREGTMVWMQYDPKYFQWMKLYPYADPPAVPLMPIILHKMALIYYIHLSASTSLNPPRIVTVGNIDNNIMPQTEEEMIAEHAEAQKMLQNNETGDFILPATWSMEVEKQARARVDDFVKELNYFDEMIGIGIGLPLGLQRQTGVRLSTDNVLREVALQRIQAFRRFYRSDFKRLFEKVLFPANGLQGHRVKLDFPPLSAEDILKKASAALTIAQAGGWADGAEMRSFLSTSIESVSDLSKKVPYDLGQIAGLAPKVEPASATA